jgi:GT2 family glycosyltransferase
MNLAIGIILFEKYTAKYLPYFFPSLIKACPQNTKVFIIDNSFKKDDNYKYFKENLFFKKEKNIIVDYRYSGKNIGFSKSYNFLINRAIKNRSDYFLVINPDTIIDSRAIEILLSDIKSHKLGSATGKIMKWDFDNNLKKLRKTDIIDSAGIKITTEHRFFDRGQGKKDSDEYNKKEEIFGASGAFAMYKISALIDVAIKNEKNNFEFFDELMFMYKEDVDLAYRLQLAGYRCLYNPKSIIYHDRTVSCTKRGFLNLVKTRKKRNKLNKEWSWLNHHIILKKMLDNKFSSDVRLKTKWFEFKSGVFVLLFERHLIKQWWKLFKMRKQIKARKSQIKKRVDIKSHIEKLMID